MRTTAKRLSLVRAVYLEDELRATLERVEAELYRAGAELDRYYAELELELERDRRRELLRVALEAEL